MKNMNDFNGRQNKSQSIGSFKAPSHYMRNYISKSNNKFAVTYEDTIKQNEVFNNVRLDTSKFNNMINNNNIKLSLHNKNGSPLRPLSKTRNHTPKKSNEKSNYRKISIKINDKQSQIKGTPQLLHNSQQYKQHEYNQQKCESRENIGSANKSKLKLKNKQNNKLSVCKYDDIVENIASDCNNDCKAIWISKRGSINFQIMENQDYVVTHEKNKNLLIYAILDGHGRYGQKIAEYFGKRVLAAIIQKEAANEDNKNANVFYRSSKSKNKSRDSFRIPKSQISLHKKNQAGKRQSFYKNEQQMQQDKAEQYKVAMTAIIEQQNRKMCRLMPKQVQNSGCTLILIIIRNQRVYTFNVGASKAVMMRTIPKPLQTSNKHNTISLRLQPQKLSSFPLSIGQTLDRFDEKARILSSRKGLLAKSKDENGCDVGPLRIWKKGQNYPGIFITRCLGMSLTTQDQLGVICTPECITLKLQQNYKFILLGSDGFWDIFTSKQCTAFMEPYWDRNLLGKGLTALLDETVKRWNNKAELMDDITIMIVRL